MHRLGACLHDPEATRHETSGFVASFIRPHGVDRPATPVFVEAVARLAGAPAPPAQDAPKWRVVVAPMVLAAALPAIALDSLTDGDVLLKMRKRLNTRARRAQRFVARTSARWRKYLERAW